MFIVDTVDGTNPTPGTHPNKSLIMCARAATSITLTRHSGGEGAYVPFPTHSFLSYLGPDQAILLLDCRIERKLDRICSETTYQRCFDAIRAHKGIKHLTILIGVPIACASRFVVVLHRLRRPAADRPALRR